MPPRHSARFPVHSYAVDAFETLALPALAGYLQEVAGQHAHALGCGMEALRGRGLTWVLSRQRIEVPRPVRLGDELEVASWASGVERLFAHREFVVTGGGGEEVARASTSWLVLDVAARRPVRPDEVLEPALRARLDPVAPVPARLPPVPPGAPERRFEVRLQEIDRNLHVNHVSYLAWALDSVPPEHWAASRACAVEVHYLAEARLGEAVLSQVAGDGGELVHAIRRAGDGKELARLRTRWAARR